MSRHQLEDIHDYRPHKEKKNSCNAIVLYAKIKILFLCVTAISNQNLCPTFRWLLVLPLSFQARDQVT